MTRFFFPLVLTALLLLGAIHIYPQSAEEPDLLNLSREEAVEMAINNNLMLESARINLDIARRRSDYVWNQFIPTVGVNGTLMRENFATVTQGGMVTVPMGGINVPVEDSPLGPGSMVINPDGIFVRTIPPQTLPQWRVNGGFTAELLLSFALVEGIRSVKLGYEAGVLSLEKAKLQMEQGVRKMYNSILLMEANAVLLDESFANAQRQAAIAEANFQAGMAPRLTWLQAQVQVENMRPTVNDLQNNIRALKGNFALLLGLPFNTELELELLDTEANLIPDDLAEFISRSANMRKPDILELQANINTLHSQRKALFYQQYTPYLRFGWNINSTFNPLLDPFQESWFKKDNWNGGGNFTITLGMSFNGLFGFTKEGQQLKDMDANIQIQNIRLAQMVRENELEIFTKLNSLENIRTIIEVQSSAVELAELTYRLTEEAYRAGLQDFQAVQNASLALDQAKLQLLTQHFNFMNDLIDLEYSLGVPFGTLSSDGTFGSDINSNSN